MPQHISHGADVEQLDDIAVRLWRQGERIADAGERGVRLLETLRVAWDGPDFEEFVGKWRAAHRGIDDAQVALRSHSRKLLDESDAQRRVSGLSSGQGGSHAGGGDGGAAVDRVVPAKHGAIFWDWLHLPVTGSPFVADMAPVLPALPGAEDVALPTAGSPALERSLPWAADQMPGEGGELPGSTASAPTQVPTSEGAHLTTTTDSAGQRSVAFDPTIPALSGGYAKGGHDQWS
ncbi:hypothetical protein ASG73_07570 [Janibacter sp. Soil728]|uniref:WXG100 family type VII secretion target n=1 Tax=Janibacter sp. Soil728 TaxID=1736393 RepID=UPI0006F91709|nr:hypothetical protein [Janibacter sp. Soil728]KRE37519.1 hypothetical protein ASG73_07570 [Janibacter sp. Soil728]